MNFLIIGDIVGKVGVEAVKKNISKLKEKYNIDFTIANGENSADGMGITKNIVNDLYACGVDAITMGNHTWGKKDIFSFIDEDERLVRPANYAEGVCGKGSILLHSKGKKIGIINLIGRVDINVLSENPFIIGKEIVNKIKNEVDIIVVDFHAEATAEKIAMARYLDGEITILFGTHTHVQTADETIFEKGTGYITDLGMTGPKHSVIGMDIDASIKRFVTTLPERYRIATGECMLNAVVFDVDDNTNKVKKINRIRK